MADKRVGRRFKEYRENAGLTQHQLARQLGKEANYISTIERGESFPGYNNLVRLMNILHISPDVLFCDVLDHVPVHHTSQLSEMMEDLPAQKQKHILQVVELMIQQAKDED